MSVSRLMNAYCFVLEFALEGQTNMDAHRIYRRRMTTDTNGNPVKDRRACRVSQLSSRELLIHSMRGSEVTHRVYFDANPELREENRLEINGLEYILLGVPTNPSLADVLWQVDVKMITHQNQKAKVIE